MDTNYQQMIKTTVYLRKEIWEQVHRSAKANRRSLNSELVWALQQDLEQQQRERS
jgi:hypothetical protein